MRTCESSPDSAVAVALGGLAAMAAVMGVGRFVYTPILPVMVETLGLTKSQAGLIASANYLGYLAGALAATAPLPGRKRVWFLGALFVSAATTAAMAAADATTAFLAIRFVGGVASAFGMIFGASLVVERLALRARADLVWLFFAGVGLGMAVSAVIVAGLAAQGFSWRAMWTASGLVSAAAFAVAARFVPDGAGAGAAPATAAAARPRALAVIALAYGLFGFGYVITATFIVAIVRASAEARPFEPFVWMVVGLAAAPSVLVWNQIAGRIGALQAFALGCLVEAAGVAASVLWVTPLGAMLAAAALGGTFVGITAIGLMAARALAANPHRAVAQMTVAFALGQIIGPVVAGYAFDATGSFVSSSLAAVAALIVAAGLAMAIRTAAPARA
jgi:predicted MFS family arabinose efflux permease